MRPGRWPWALGMLGPLALAGACDSSGPGDPSDAIPVDVFIDTYVDLRIADLQTPGNEIIPADRERILAEHGVTSEDLLEFVETHGRDVPYIAEVWDSVEVRFRRKRDSIHAQGMDSTG
ncbi:MAG: hypothetical protein R3E10_00700 [Gemmatimonadota bacterium]